MEVLTASNMDPMGLGEGNFVDPTDITGYNGGKLAATVILLRDGATGLEVWVQERVSSMPNYPGMTVFPGGGVDSRDLPPQFGNARELWEGPSAVSLAQRMGTTRYKAHALVFAAIRELFEETGTLLALEDDGEYVKDTSIYHAERKALVTHQLSLTDMLRDNNLRIDTDYLLPFARWVGHSESGKWFDTHSFIARAPDGQTPDGQTTEASDANWFSPSLLIEGWCAGLVRLVVPTWAQLRELSEHDSVESALNHARNADMTPIRDDLIDDPRFSDYFTYDRIDRI